MSASVSASARQRDADRGGIEHRHVALDIDDGVMGPLRVERRERGVDAVRAGRQRRVGHDGASAGALDRLGDLAVAAGDDDRAAIGGDRQAPDMHDHRRPGDLGQRLARQPARGEPRRYQQNGVADRVV